MACKSIVLFNLKMGPNKLLLLLLLWSSIGFKTGSSQTRKLLDPVLFLRSVFLRLVFAREIN